MSLPGVSGSRRDGDHRPRPAAADASDLLDGLPRRAALTLPELQLVAERAGNAPLPFGRYQPGPRRPASTTGSGRARPAPTWRRTPTPWPDSTTRGSRCRGAGSDRPRQRADAAVDDGLLGAVGLLATPTLALDLDITAGGVQAKAWHRQSGDAVAALSTQDGVVFELAWFPTWAWAAELGRVAVIPEDVALRDSRGARRRRPAARARGRRDRGGRRNRRDLVAVLVDQHSGRVTDGPGRRCSDATPPGCSPRSRASRGAGSARWWRTSRGTTAFGGGGGVDAGRRRLARAATPTTVDEPAPRRDPPGHPRGPGRRAGTGAGPGDADRDDAVTADRYDAMLRLADAFDAAGDELRARSGLGVEVLRDPAVADSADLAPVTHARAEDDIRAATTGKHGLMSRSLELDADALVVRATVLTYQWIDELREVAATVLGSIAGRAIGYLAPNVELGGAIVSAGLIETDALDREDVAAYLNELAAENPELMDHVTTGGGGLLDGLQMRALLTSGFVSGESGRQVARGGPARPRGRPDAARLRRRGARRGRRPRPPTTADPERAQGRRGGTGARVAGRPDDQPAPGAARRGRPSRRRAALHRLPGRAPTPAGGRPGQPGRDRRDGVRP